MVLASSIHAVSGYPPGRQVRPDDPVNPGDLYGVSKCFGEAMGRYMAVQQGLSVLAVRIGAFQPLSVAEKARSPALIHAFVSRRDLDQLLRRSLDDVTLRFGIFHGLSDNPLNRLSTRDARELLGYEPEDNFAAQYPPTRELGLGEGAPPHDERHNGPAGIRRELEP